jgi:hypothetical protein
VRLPEGHWHFWFAPHKEVAPGVWLHEIGTKDEWIELLLPRAQLAFWRQQHRDNVLYFYNEYRSKWKWDRAVSDRAVRGEIAPNRSMKEQDYIIGASQTANGFMVVEILKERTDGQGSRRRLRIIERGCQLAIRGRFKLTDEAVED